MGIFIKWRLSQIGSFQFIVLILFKIIMVGEKFNEYARRQKMALVRAKAFKHYKLTLIFEPITLRNTV